MKPDLRAALEAVGWDELYEAYVPALVAANARGERRGVSPFPDVVDHNPSFSCNVITGVWRCFKSNRGGDYVLFRAILDAREFDPSTQLAIPDYGAAERALMREYNLSRPVDPAWVEACRADLQADPLALLAIARTKPWNRHAMAQLGVGFDHETNRLTFPIYDQRGRLVNVRMYRPGGGEDFPKWVWFAKNTGGNFLWPAIAWHEASVILTEGETDALSLRSLGFPGVSGTVGSGHPVPEGEWWRGRHVWILMDVDAPGVEATHAACRIIRDLAASVRVVRLPEWPGRGPKADVSDYIMHLTGLGLEPAQVQRAISELLAAAEEMTLPHAIFDAEPRPVSFAQAMSSDNLNQRIRFTARVVARSSTRLLLPYMKGVAVKDFLWRQNAKGKWAPAWCGLGKGMVDFQQFFQMIKAGGFSGPLQLHMEYPELGGANEGHKEFTIPKDRLIAIMKRDLDLLRGMLRDASYS